MQSRWFLIGSMSLLLVATGFNTVRAAEEKEENEQKVSFQDVPKAVRKTLTREANGESIKSVDKEQLKGKTVYEADVKIDGHNYEIVVDEAGTLQYKKLDEGEGAKTASSESKQKKEKKEGKGEKEEKD